MTVFRLPDIKLGIGARETVRNNQIIFKCSEVFTKSMGSWYFLFKEGKYNVEYRL